MIGTKLLITVIITTLLTGASTGCEKQQKDKTSKQTQVAEEQVEETNNDEYVTDIPNAKEFPEIEWPTFGIVTKIPEPTWSNHGEILTDSELNHWSEIGYATVNDFEEYVNACQDSGFTVNSYYEKGYMYYAENEDGEVLQLTYNQYDHYVGIILDNDVSGWSKWWEE